MATITAGDFRNGKTFEMDGKIFQVVEFQHVKPGKGAAFVRTKMKNIITGGVTETSFNPTAKFEEAFVERKKMSYSYNDGDLYYFIIGPGDAGSVSPGFLSAFLENRRPLEHGRPRNKSPDIIPSLWMSGFFIWCEGNERRRMRAGSE